MSDHHKSHYLGRALRMIEAIEVDIDEAARHEDLAALDLIAHELRLMATAADDSAYQVEELSRNPDPTPTT